MEWSEGDLVWFDPNLGHPLPGEIQEVHHAAQVIIVQALINGKVSEIFLYSLFFSFFGFYEFVISKWQIQGKNR